VGAPETSRTAGHAADEALGDPTPVPKHGWRDRIRTKPGIGQLYRVGVFIAGLLCVAAGFALAVLPGPLTIPPVLLGLYIWSTEFRWAKRLFDSFAVKAKEAWAHAKAKPVSSALITVGGIAAAIVAVLLVRHYELAAKAKDAVGL
jgi:hypothetical protein